MSLRDAHTWWSWPVIVTNALVGLWALVAHVRPSWRGRALWWSTGAAQATIVVQLILGVALQSSLGIEAPQIHVFYGFVALIAAALIYSYRQQIIDQQYLLYGFGGLFIMGLAIRAAVLS